MSPTKLEILPLLPLPKDKVLLPGSILRVPLSNRPDLLALVSHVLSASVSTTRKLPKPGGRTIVVGCVPLSTAHEGTPGQKRTREVDTDDQSHGERFGVSEQADTRNLYYIGTAAAIRGFVGRGMEELALVVQGLRRFRIESISQGKSFLEAQVTYSDKEGSVPGNSLV